VKTLTYGTLPGFKAFEIAFYKEASVPQGMYRILLSSSDAATFKAVGLGCATLYDCESLYDLVRDLRDAWDSDVRGDDVADAAGSFASSIMFTLGFEWM
jgi:hypothetical protein